MAPEFSIIVPTRGRSERLSDLLTALARQDPAGPSFEVVIALDGSGGADSIDRQGCVALRVLELPQVGIAAAKNAAVAASRGEVLLFLNDDVEPEQDFLQRHAEAQRGGHPIVLGDSPWVRWEDQTLFDELIAHTPMIFFYPDMCAGKGHGFRYAWNLNLSIDRAWMEQRLGAAASTAGPFNASFRPLMYEDLELAFRLCGHEPLVYYHPAARAAHRHRYGLSDYFRREAMLGVMAPVLAQVNPACFEAVFGGSLERVAGDAESGLGLDQRDGIRLLRLLQEVAGEPVSGPVSADMLRITYAAHLPLKRRAFRRGLTTGLQREACDWRERPGIARASLETDPVFGPLFASFPTACDSAKLEAHGPVVAATSV